MSKVALLKCPNCGARLDKDQLTCQYCGAESILSTDGSTLRFKSEINCPKCGFINEKSSWFCTVCHTILTKDIEPIKEMQRKIRLEEDQVKQSLPLETRYRIDPNEYIYFSFKLGNGAYIITDKRLIKNRNGVYQEAKLSEITNVGQPQVKRGLGVFASNITLSFVVKTFNGTILFGDFSRLDANSFGTFYAWVIRAIRNQNSRKKDARALLFSLQLP